MFYFGQSFTLEILISLVVLCIGVGISTVTQIGIIKLNGFIYSIIAIISTSQVSIVSGNKMKEFNMNSIQLLNQTSSFCSSIMLLSIPIFDNVGIKYTLSRTNISLFQFNYNTTIIVS